MFPMASASEGAGLAGASALSAGAANVVGSTRKAIVFDFDETLAVDTGHPRSNYLTLFGGEERLQSLRLLLSTFRSK